MLIGAAFAIAAINTGAEQVAWASSQPEVIAKEQAAAQQWQDNCMGQCHYADHVSSTPGVVAGGASPDTPVNDTLAEGYYNIAQGTVGVVGSATGLIGLGLTASRQAVTNSTSATQYVDDLANDVSDWVSQGGGARVIRNGDGDFILVNDANTRKFRFDFFNPNPHQPPHMHLEWLDDEGNWVRPGQIYPSDVEPR